ncbi:MAG: hypothetical protein MUC50_17085 [Myxococcota bacterium]|jgi:hypothetical protein|nr:hypothetical protein [Myxococcota bacterium]
MLQITRSAKMRAEIRSSGRVGLVVLCVAALLRSPLAMASDEVNVDVDVDAQKTVESEESTFDFGVFGVLETASGLNADRPSVGSLLQVTPQLKYREIYRLKLNMGFMWSYLDRAPNPWDFTDWSLELADLSIVKEKRSGLNLSGNLRYYIPLSVDSRSADSRGAVRGLAKLDLPIWKFNIGLNLMGFYRFAQYTTSDPTRWTDPDKMLSNGRVSFGEGLELGFAPIERVNIGLSWTFYQHQDYYPKQPYEGSGSSFVADRPRKNDVWEHTWAAGAEVSVHVWKPFHVAVGYQSASPVLLESARGLHYNPFDPKVAQVFLDLMVIY